jgi:hypothetical protein
MAIGVTVDSKRYEIGSSDFFNAFFSTVVMRLEGGEWGSRFPTVMNRLYMGEVAPGEVPQLQNELNAIREQLKAFTPDLVVWDFEDPSRRPPWGASISSHIKSLSNYFWTSDGKDLFETLLTASDSAARTRASMIVE